MRLKRVERRVLINRPPAYSALREPSGDEPKSARVVRQHFERRAAAVPENEQGAGERVLRERLLTKGRQAIDAVAEIDGIDGEENLELRN